MSRQYTPSNLKTISLNVSGLETYMKKIQAAGHNIDDVVAEAINQSAKPIYESMNNWAEKHELTGATKDGIVKTDVIRSGNEISVEIGIDTSKNENAWHAVFVEYGTPKQEADPGIQQSFIDNKSLVKKIQRNILKKAGMIDG